MNRIEKELPIAHEEIHNKLFSGKPFGVSKFLVYYPLIIFQTVKATFGKSVNLIEPQLPLLYYGLMGL